MALIYLTAAWVVGIYLGSRLSLPGLVAPIAIAANLGLAVLARGRRRMLLGLLCLAALCGGILRYQTLPVPSQGLAAFNGKGTVQIEGVVDAEPDYRDRSARYQFSAHSLRQSNEALDIDGAVMVYARSYPRYRYGDALRLTGKLETPPVFEDFNFREYLERQGIYSTMRYPQIELLERGQGPALWEALYTTREALAASLAASLPEPQASLAQGILLGLRSGIPQDLYDAFNRTGTSHIIAISGQNISIVAGMLAALAAWALGRHRPLYLWLSAGAVWLYTLLAGADPPVVRAAIMGSLVLAAWGLGRPGSALHSLALAAAIMVGHEPAVLWDLGFQLSFAAMLGLVLARPPFEAMARPLVEGLRDMGREGTAAFVAGTWGLVAATVGASLGVFPILAHAFHRFPLVSLPATLLGLLALPGIIITSALTAVSGLIFPPLAQALGWVAWLFLSYLISIVNLSAMGPAPLEIRITEFELVGCYVLFGGVFWLASQNRGSLLQHLSAGIAGARIPFVWLAGSLAIATALIWAAALTAPDGQVHVSFLDIGQGDAILIQTPNRRILVDGGPSPQILMNRLGESLPFWQRSIDLVVLSHPQEDHLLGLIEVARRYRVQRVLEASCPFTSTAYAEWHQTLEAKEIQRWTAEAGQRISLDQGIWLEVIHPPPSFATKDINNCSVVLRLGVGRVSFLLTGDIGTEAENSILARVPALESTVLKVAHHGSASSSSPRFVSAVGPQAAVICVGDNNYGHPHPDTLERLAGRSLFRTDRHGSIELITNGARLWVRHE